MSPHCCVFDLPELAGALVRGGLLEDVGLTVLGNVTAVDAVAFGVGHLVAFREAERARVAEGDVRDAGACGGFDGEGGAVVLERDAHFLCLCCCLCF